MSKVQQYWGQAITASLDWPPALNVSLRLSISIILAWDIRIFLENADKKMKLKIEANKKEAISRAAELTKPMNRYPKTQVSPWFSSLLLLASPCPPSLPSPPSPVPHRCPKDKEQHPPRAMRSCGCPARLVNLSTDQTGESQWTSLRGSLSFLQSHWFLQ